MITVDEGKSFTLACTASGVPSPNIRWQYQGSDVSGPSKGGTSASIGQLLQMNSITYHVVESTPDLSGWYTCRADQNLIGNVYSDLRMINLNVKGESQFFHFRSILCVAITRHMARNASHFAANWPTSRSNEFRQKKSKKKWRRPTHGFPTLHLNLKSLVRQAHERSSKLMSFRLGFFWGEQSGPLHDEKLPNSYSPVAFRQC